MTMSRFALAVLTLTLAGPAGAAQCGNDASGFEAWKAQFKKEAAASGLSPRTVAVLDSVKYDAGIIKLDRTQRAQSARQDLSSGRVSQGRSRLKQYAGLLSQLEKRYGVPGPVLVAIWGMETDYGAVRGKKQTIRSLATLAYDCRRSAFFTRELLAALTIVQRGKLSPNQMVGGWAGEIGQTQFLASKYLQYGVDGSGDGRADVVGNPADVLASTANFLRAHGWRAGAGWEPGQPNFGVIAAWNKSSAYQKTVARLATMLAGG